MHMRGQFCVVIERVASEIMWRWHVEAGTQIKNPRSPSEADVAKLVVEQIVMEYSEWFKKNQEKYHVHITKASKMI